MIPLLLLAAQAVAATPLASCRYDRPALLALDQDAFDQEMAGGWRALSNRGCLTEAADLIRDWSARHRPDAGDATILHWHEGQLRAMAGQTAAAIALFENSRKPAAEDTGFGWNHYVDGSIAFLRRDRPALQAARARLATVRRPPDYDPRDADGHPILSEWPPNLTVLDGLLRCWTLSYAKAYSCAASR